MDKFWFNRPFKGETALLDSSDNEMKCSCLRDASINGKIKYIDFEQNTHLLLKVLPKSESNFL